MIRVLVTGSRNWPQPSTVYTALRTTHAADRNMTVLSGNCSTGADLHAEVWAELNHAPIELYPADWRTWGRMAGPIRNRTMLDTRPDLVLAFIHNGSRGATGCLEETKVREIPWACYRTTECMPGWIGYEDSETARIFSLSAALDQWRRDHESGRSGVALRGVPPRADGY